MKEYRMTDWLPTTKKEVELRGWDELDVILFSGDAYVDHPSFGAAVIGRILEAEGLRIAIIPQPNWRDDLRDFKKLGRPRLFFGISAGCMDSMVNKYTANKRLRSEDAYTPDARPDMRPEYPSIVYTQILKNIYPDVPVVLGGIEASLRRVSHYDYWQDELRKSILVDSGADLLIYGMGEKPIVEMVERMKDTANASPDKRFFTVSDIKELFTISQIAYTCKTSDFASQEGDIRLASHANLDEYVSLFPVNPSFFDNFQQIKIGKSQREILKTLSSKFEKIADDEIPETEPGLICYDSYWDDLQSSQMQTYPDIRRITDIMQTVHQKINDNFTGARVKKIPLAHRIANACAVKILQDSLEKTNGANAISLVDDLCYLDSSCFSRELLLDTFTITADQIVQATDGQYFTMNAVNQEYHIRVEGGVNYEQKIKAFASTMSEDNKDSHFFNFLVEYLPITTEQYRREFKIFPHSIDWASHKIQLDGYIFMGNPSERSTTQPEQNFYIYFMFFTAIQAAEYEEKKKAAPEFVSLGIIVSDEASGIQWLRNQLRDTPKTYQEIQPDWMQAINGLRKNDILPELKQILEENFIEMEDGKWRLPNIQDDVDKEALRTKSLLREFKRYVEAASKPKAKIKEARVEALRAGFKQCYIEKDFKTIVLVGNKIPQNLRDEDEILLQFYDIAVNKI